MNRLTQELIKDLLPEDWWTDMSVEAQKQYLADYPNSPKAIELSNPSGKKERGDDDWKQGKDGWEILDDERWLRVKTHILTVFNDYVTNHLQIQNQFYLTQSWTAVNQKGDAHHSHIHPNCIFSCVYYVQASSGDLQIKMPLSRIQEGYNLSYKVLQQNVFNSRTINLSVKTGDMVIFPGWCEHMALPNENDSPRIILGTNYFVTGWFGDYDNKDLIQI